MQPHGSGHILPGLVSLRYRANYMDTIQVRGRAPTTSRISTWTSPGQTGGDYRPVGLGQVLLAFDTLYAEGQRRYVESLSTYARQFLSMMEKPDYGSYRGSFTAISIEQKSTSHNPRSTVGTITEIYDYLRLLFARVGEPRCPITVTTCRPRPSARWSTACWPCPRAAN